MCRTDPSEARKPDRFAVPACALGPKLADTCLAASPACIAQARTIAMRNQACSSFQNRIGAASKHAIATTLRPLELTKDENEGDVALLKRARKHG